MMHPLLVLLIILTPVVALVSGMMLAPLLGILALLILVSTPKAAYANPKAFLANYKQVLWLEAGMLVLPILTYFWSIVPSLTLQTALGATAVCLAGTISFMYTTVLESPTTKTLRYYALSFVIVSLVLLQEHVPHLQLIQVLFEHLHKDYDRFIEKNVNRGVCALVVLIWPLMLGFGLAGKRRDAIALFILVGIAVLSMHSLSAKVGLISGAIAFVGLQRFPTTFGRAIVILFPLFLLSFPFLFKLMEYTFFALPQVQAHLPESAIQRLGIWHALYDTAMQRPWLGWGINSTRALPISQDILKPIGLGGPPLHPHSPSLQILLEQGIVGMALTIGAFALLLREWARMPAEKQLHRATAGALIVAYFATGVSSFGIWQHWWIATLFIAGIFWRWMGRAQAQPV